MLIEKTDIFKRSIQTTITFPLSLYLQLVNKAKTEKVSLSELVRNAVLKQFETRKEKDLGDE